jgi:signal transduction histidine kinase
MNLSLQVRTNPIRFLLYSEWLMLLSCGSMALIETIENQQVPVAHLLILIILGLMGLTLPKDNKTRQKIIYTAIEIGLIFYGTYLGYLHILPTLYLIVTIRSCFLFKPFGRWLVASLSLALFLLHQLKYIYKVIPFMQTEMQHQIWMHQLSEVLLFGMSLFFVLQFVNNWLTESQIREQLGTAHIQLQNYALKIEDLATVQERNRIARDIHDSLGHTLTALNVQLQTTVKLWSLNPAKAKSFLNQAQQLGKLAIQEVRQSIHTLRDDNQKIESLATSLEDLVKDFRKGTGITIVTNIKIDSDLSAELVKNLYRIVQEALTNISKHAQASVVFIQLSTTPGKVTLFIDDDGEGFSQESDIEGFGLQGMQERVTFLHGTLRVSSNPGTGCRIKVELPTETPYQREKETLSFTDIELEDLNPGHPHVSKSTNFMQDLSDTTTLALSDE